MRCLPISQHHRRGRRAGAEASRLINEAGHAPRIGAGNGALGQETARGSGARPAHWGRQRCIGAGKLPTPMPVFLPQCGSPYSGAHCSRGLEPRSAPKNAPSAPRSGQRGSSAVPTDCVQHTPRRRPVFTAIPRSAWADPQGCPVQRLCFHSNTTLSQRYHTLQALQHLQSDGIPLKTPLHLQTTPAPAQRQRNVGIPGESSCNPPQRARLPFENTTSLAKQPEPPALDHSALRDKGTSSASTSPARSWANVGPHWGRKQRVGAGNRSLGQANNLPQCRLTCPNAD